MHMNAFGRTSTVAGLMLLGACATGGASSASKAGAGVWTGSFRQPQVAASSVIGPATANRAAAYGTISLTPSPDGAGRYQVELSLSAPVDPNTQLAWAVFSGPCGTPSPAVAGTNEFPHIEIGSGGGSVHTVMALALDPHQTYHANVYWSSRASDVSNVMMCAKLVVSQ
jgi:hypothetical protein